MVSGMIDSLTPDPGLRVEIGSPRSSKQSGLYGVSAMLRMPDREFELFYQTNAGALWTGTEPFLAAALFAAMKVNASLHVATPTSPMLLRGVDRIQKIYGVWDRSLTRVPVMAEGGLPVAPSPDRQVACFFSGGVNSFYSVLEHLDEIDQLIFVRGFDIRRDYQEVWDRIAVSIRDAAAELGKPIVEVDTNFQEYSDQFLNWNFYFGAALAGVSLALSSMFRKVYIPASHSYAQLLPWGSSPLVDPLWSTESLEIVHDGCEAGRIEKVARIARSETALKYLRVCFQNRRPEWKDAYNCGQCEKCLRTMLNLYLVGALDRCQTFGHTLDLDAIARMPAPTAGALPLVMENLEAAERQQADPALIAALRESLHRPAPPQVQMLPQPQTVPAATPADPAVQELEEQNSSLRAAIDEIHASHSWRLTGPLRTLKDAYRKMRE